MVRKNSDVHSKGKNPKTTKDESKMVIHRKIGYFNFLKIKGDEMKAQKIVEKVDTKTKKEIANMWQKLDATQKAEYESKTPSTNASNKSCLKIGTRCSPKDLKDTINVLSDEKKAAIEEMGFVSLLEMKCGKLSHSMCRFLVDKLNPAESSIMLHGKTFKISVDDFVRIMGVKDGGEEVDFTGSMDEQDIVKVRNSFLGGKKLLKNNELKQIMVGTKEAGDFFKVGFVTFALCTLLCPTTSVYVNLKYLLPLRDSKAIARKNWASYSFRFLLDSVKSFKENNQVYIGGCLLFLQLFYLDALAHGSVLVDKSVLPLTVWGTVETEKMKQWLQKRGGFESDKVIVMKTEYGSLGDDAKTMTHFAEELSSIRKDVATLVDTVASSIRKDVATLVATVARMDESLSKIMSELSSKNEEKERITSTPCHDELEVKLNKKDDNMFDMRCDGGQKDLGNTKPSKSRPHKEDGTPNEQDDNVKGFATVEKTSAPSIEVIHERKHAKQPHNEDKMGHNEVKSLFLENCSSTSTRDPIVTRATAKRKPGPHKRTPYEDINELKAKANAKTRHVIAHERIMKRLGVGPFRMTNDLSEDDRDLLSFAFCCNPLDPKVWSELLVDTGAVVINRHHFGSLAPGSPLFDDVINVMAEYLYDTTSTKWFLPTFFWSEGAKLARPSDRMTSCARTHNFCRLARFNRRLKDCMQIYIPMHDDVIGHWYLLVCDIFHKKAEIWDSLPDARHNKKRENDCHISLLYLDSVFHDDILSVFGTEWTFSSFSVVSPLNANPIQPNGVDCGIFVIRHMQYYRQLWYDRYDPNEQRMQLAIELIRNEKNLLRDAIIREALKVMENGSDFMAKGNKIGNVEVKDKDVADVTVRRKRVYIRKQNKSVVTIPETRTSRGQPRPRRR